MTAVVNKIDKNGLPDWGQPAWMRSCSPVAWDQLTELHNANRDLLIAQRRIQIAACLAHGHGVPVAVIAERLGVSRPTAYKLVEDGGQ